jgi:hypothetical protein
MNNSSDNPPSNQLGPGLNEAQVLGAVERSGYPLQTVVASVLGSSFGVKQEWCYIDRDSKELRAIDMHARRLLHDWGNGPQPRIRPHLDLLVECKQSQLPYMFFLSGSTPVLLDHPAIAGLAEDKIEIVSDDDISTWTYGVINALDLHKDSFQQAPPYSDSFSKCVRKGAEIELSGTEAYSGLVLPLIKALHHFRIAEQPVETAWYFDAHLTLALGVLDAPMIGVSVENGTTALTLTPWVRVVRHEYLEQAEKWDRDHLWAIDVVHKDFLTTYIHDHALPFAERFSDRALKHITELATRKGFVPGMGRDSWGAIENRLKPRPTTAGLNRTKLIFGNVIRLVTRRKTDS